MKKYPLLLVFLAGIFSLFAQETAVDDGFFLPPEQKSAWLLDWGATLSPVTLFEYSGSSGILATTAGGSAWARLSLPGQWRLYARIRDTLVYSILPLQVPEKSFNNLWELNTLYLQTAIPEAGFTLSIGRKPFLLGSGLVLAGNGDGIEFQLAMPVVVLKGFGFFTGLQKTDFSAYGMGSWDDEHGAQRYFGGYSAGVVVAGHELSLLGMYQGDFGLDVDQLYTSWYTGLQAKGLLLDGEYLLEWYLQNGTSPLAAMSSSIVAFGGTCHYDIVLKAKTSPSLGMQYSLASGDPDRTSTRGSLGNASGLDTAFQAFGQLGSGSAFRPHFSNIHIAGLLFSFTPFEAASNGIRNTIISLKYFYYLKYSKAGIVNTDEAPLPSNDLGHGIDLSAQWSPYGDVGFFLNSGLFFPGTAFPAAEPFRFIVSGGMSLSF